MEQAKQLYPYSWVVLSSVLLAYCLYIFQRSDISTIIPRLTTVYHWNLATVGWINSAMVWSYAAMQIPFGYLSDRWLGARETISLGTFLLVLGAVIFGLVLPNVDLSILVRILIGTGSAAILVPANSMFAQWFPSARRGLQTAILFSGGQIAMIIASVLMPVLVSGPTHLLGMSSTQSAFLLVGLPMVLAIPIVFWFTRNKPEDMGLPPIQERATENKSGASEGESTGFVLRHSISPYVLTLVYVGFIGGSNINVWLTVFFVNVYSMDEVLAALLFTMVSVVPWVVGQPLAGLLGDLVGHRRVVVYSLLASVITLALITLLIALYGTIPLQYMIGLLVLFWVFTSAMVNSWPLTTELFSPKLAGTVAGMMNTGGNLAGAVATVVPGYFIATHSSYLPVFAFGTLIVLVGLVASFFLPAKRAVA